MLMFQVLRAEHGQAGRYVNVFWVECCYGATSYICKPLKGEGWHPRNASDSYLEGIGFEFRPGTGYIKTFLRLS